MPTVKAGCKVCCVKQSLADLGIQYLFEILHTLITIKNNVKIW